MTKIYTLEHLDRSRYFRVWHTPFIQDSEAWINGVWDNWGDTVCVCVCVCVCVPNHIIITEHQSATKCVPTDLDCTRSLNILTLLISENISHFLQ